MRHSLTRAVAFHATHRYHLPEWSDAENRARFGWTSEAPGHGHLYRVEVTVTGPLDPRTGMVMDLVALDAILAEQVTGPLGGRHLNDVAPELPLPTCEALAAWCAARVADRLPAGIRIARVRVAEDESLWAECVAEQ